MTDELAPQSPALAGIQAIFQQYGLMDLWEEAKRVVKEQGYTDGETVAYALRGTDPYNKRFAANKVRAEKGLPELSPGAYVQLEQSYRDIVDSYGVSHNGFYDKREDFTSWIENNISARQAENRVLNAKKATENIDPAYRQTMRDFYGLNDNDLADYFLDPSRKLDLLERQANAGLVGAAGRANNFTLSSNTAEVIGSHGVSYQDALQRFDRAASEADSAKRLGSIYGDTVNKDDLVKEAFDLEGGNDVTNRKKKLASQERGAFSGTGGVGSSSLRQKKSVI